MTLCRPSSLLESDQEPQPFGRGGESEMGNRTVTIGTLVGDSHTWGYLILLFFPKDLKLALTTPFLFPKRNGSQKIFQEQFVGSRTQKKKTFPLELTVNIISKVGQKTIYVDN